MSDPTSAALRVLVVGDDPLARRGIALAIAGVESISVVGETDSSGACDDALARLDPDVVIWDLAGAEDSAEDVRERVDAPVVTLTDEVDVAEAALRYGLEAAVGRDARPERLVAALHAAVNGLVVLDAPLALEVFDEPAAPAMRPVDALTPRELEVLAYLAEGLSNRRIASELDISEHTVKFHLNAILSKLQAESRTQAVVRAIRLGLVRL